MSDLIICRCEEVSLEDLKETENKYKCSARELKLRTRAGMGYCGGRTCRPAVDHIVSELTNHKLTDEKLVEHLPLKVQPPVRPLTLENLGGLTDEE